MLGEASLLEPTSHTRCIRTYPNQSRPKHGDESKNPVIQSQKIQAMKNLVKTRHKVPTMSSRRTREPIRLPAKTRIRANKFDAWAEYNAKAEGLEWT